MLVESIVEQSDLSNLLKGKPLTKVERIILSLILQDKTNKEIAQILHRVHTHSRSTS
ncbi:MAG: LuxR C-terminal-related transcriptional regulator [Planctomycetota bacterium]|jgi:DNA-binding CsgD family transcriptional regulator